MTSTTKAWTGLYFQIYTQQRVRLARRSEVSILRWCNRLRICSDHFTHKLTSNHHRLHSNTRPQYFESLTERTVTLTTKPCTDLCYQIWKHHKVRLAKRSGVSFLKECKRLRIYSDRLRQKVISMHRSHANTRPHISRNCQDSKKLWPPATQRMHRFMSPKNLPTTREFVRLANSIKGSVFSKESKSSGNLFGPLETKGEEKKWDKQEE